MSRIAEFCLVIWGSIGLSIIVWLTAMTLAGGEFTFFLNGTKYTVTLVDRE